MDIHLSLNGQNIKSVSFQIFGRDTGGKVKLELEIM